jgi:hypothetical protein
LGACLLHETILLVFGGRISTYGCKTDKELLLAIPCGVIQKKVLLNGSESILNGM